MKARVVGDVVGGERALVAVVVCAHRRAPAHVRANGPEGWEERISQTTGVAYYFNR